MTVPFPFPLPRAIRAPGNPAIPDASRVPGAGTTVAGAPRASRCGDMPAAAETRRPETRSVADLATRILPELGGWLLLFAFLGIFAGIWVALP